MKFLRRLKPRRILREFIRRIPPLEYLYGRLRPDHRKPGWMVTATVDEPLELLCAYVAHYLEMGAQEVHLFLDRPNPEVEAVLTSVPGVRITNCDADYWASTQWGTKPLRHTWRQTYNAQRAYEHCPYHWFLFCDADEFVYLPGRMDDILNKQRARVDFLRIRVAERIFERDVPPKHIFDGLFRTPVRAFKKLGEPLYGKNAQFLTKGLLGHNQGKTIIRTRRPYKIKLHFPRPKGKAQSEAKLLSSPRYHTYVPDAYLVHFDGMTPLHWGIKLLNKYRSLMDSLEQKEQDADQDETLDDDQEQDDDENGFDGASFDTDQDSSDTGSADDTQDPLASSASAALAMDSTHRTRGRKNQIVAMVEARDNPVRLRHLLSLPVLAPATIEKLRRRNNLAEVRIDPGAAAIRLFPDAGLDFSTEAFDARLRELHRDLLEEGIEGRPVSL